MIRLSSSFLPVCFFYLFYTVLLQSLSSLPLIIISALLPPLHFCDPTHTILKFIALFTQNSDTAQKEDTNFQEYLVYTISDGALFSNLKLTIPSLEAKFIYIKTTSSGFDINHNSKSLFHYFFIVDG